MSSSRVSSQQSQNSKPVQQQQQEQQRATKSLVVSKVSLSFDEAGLLQDLGHNYKGIDKVSRMHDMNGNPIGAIRVDFKSEKACMEVLNDDYISIHGKTFPMRPYYTRVCRRCRKEGHYAAECPQKYLTEERLNELFAEQRAHLEKVINDFESKWNARISAMEASSTSINAEKLAPIFRDLSTFSQQFMIQNSQMQRQIAAISSRVQNIQPKSSS